MAYASTDLSNATYTDPSGGVSIPALTKLSEFHNILDYGGDPSGANDNRNAFFAALNALPAAGGTVYFPSGTFVFSAGVTVSLSGLRSVTISGAGQEATKLLFGGPTAPNGLSAVFDPAGGNYIASTFNVRDLTVATVASQNGTGLFLGIVNGGKALNPGFSPVNTITRVNFHGNQGIVGTTQRLENLH